MLWTATMTVYRNRKAHVVGIGKFAHRNTDHFPLSNYARVVLVNPDVDIALLATDDDFKHLPLLSLAADDSLQISDKVHVAGYPYGAATGWHIMHKQQNPPPAEPR